MFPDWTCVPWEWCFWKSVRIYNLLIRLKINSTVRTEGSRSFLTLRKLSAGILGVHFVQATDLQSAVTTFTAFGQLRLGVSIDNSARAAAADDWINTIWRSNRNPLRVIEAFPRTENDAQTLSRQQETSRPLTTTNSARRRRWLCLKRSFLLRLPGGLPTKRYKWDSANLRGESSPLKNRLDKPFFGCKEAFKSEWEGSQKFLDSSFCFHKNVQTSKKLNLLHNTSWPLWILKIPLPAKGHAEYDISVYTT